jgi:hypothetical protein
MLEWAHFTASLLQCGSVLDVAKEGSMPDWQTELAALLKNLAVDLEPAPASPPALNGSSPRRALEGMDDPAASEMMVEAAPLEGDEVAAVRGEIEATLARVIHLTNAGKLDRAIRDDVVFVLQALTRPRPGSLRGKAKHEWQLASAAAVLHFCRVIMRLTRSRSLEPGS